MNKLNLLDWLAFILVVVGGLNWGLVGVLNFDLVEYLFGASVAATVVYDLVGLAALYVVVMLPKYARK